MSSLLRCKFRCIELPGLPPIELSFVKGGVGVFGSTREEADEDEKPIHKAILSDFWMMRYPVSQTLYTAVMEHNRSRFTSGQRPVEKVSWEEAIKFVGRLNNLYAKECGIGWDSCFGLPTEHQWEYASRAGIYSRGHEQERYSGSDDLDEVGWYMQNGFGGTMTSGLKRPNQLGLFDMSGNVREWCADPWEIDFYERLKNKTNIDPVATGDNDWRVVRGGSWGLIALWCRAADRGGKHRDVRNDILGFRLIFSQFAVDP